MNSSDILIIGGGPGGYETALKARQSGKSVTLIEKGELGGTCLNRGCIPTKALCRSAELALLLSGADAYGIKGAVDSIDFTAVMERKTRVVTELREGVESLLKEITVVRGEARFVSATEVSVNGELYSAPQIIIATGSQPAVLRLPGGDSALSSDDLLSLSKLPESLVIVGGGVIGMEFASIFASFGVKITVIEYCDEILPPFDKEIAKRLRTSLKRRGIDIITGAKVTGICQDGTVSYEAKGRAKTVTSQLCAVAVGRQPVLPPGIESTGVKIERGALVVDDQMRCLAQVTGNVVPGLYAIGDVNGRCMLAHAASMQGEVALGLRALTQVIPSAVFTHPEAAMVGLTEEQALARNYDIKIGKSTFRANGKAMAMGETEGLVKIIADNATGKILGCHIVGAHAADLVQEAAIAISSGLTVGEVENCVFAHPTLSEVLRAALPITAS